MMDTDEMAVRRDGVRAVSDGPADEARILVRASLLLSLRCPPAAVARSLGLWAQLYPHLVGTAPEVVEPDPWRAALDAARPARCPHLLRPSWGPDLQRCMLGVGHTTPCDAGPF